MALMIAAWPRPSLAQAPSDEAELDYIGSLTFLPEQGLLSAGWTIRVLDPEIETLSFALADSFGQARVTGRSVERLNTVQNIPYGEGLRRYDIALRPAKTGEVRVVRFAYTGPLLSERFLIPFNTLNAEKIELTVDSFWFPFEMRFDRKITANLGIRILGNWTAVATGAVKPVSGGFQIRQDRPAMDIAFSLLSRADVETSDSYAIYDARLEPGTKRAELKRALSVCIDYLNDLSGAAVPLPKLSVIVTDRPDGGYSRGGLISLTDIENESDANLQKFICHELAHYWSYANANGPDNWINEGVADYLALISLRDTFGEATYQIYLRDYEESVTGQNLVPIWTPTSEGRPSYLNSYRAAPLALRDLEEKIGRALFLDLMQAVMTQKTKTTQEMLALIEAVADLETRLWFKARLGQ